MNRESAKWHTVPIMILVAVFHSDCRAEPGHRFIVRLSEPRQVSPPSTAVRAKADFRFNRDFTALRYRFSLGKGSAVLGVSLRCASQGASGPVVATLLGKIEGGLAGKAAIRASLTDANLVPDSDCTPTSGAAIHNLADLADAMERGAVYMDIATAANPEEEFRAQVTAPGTVDPAGQGSGVVPAAKAAIFQAIQAQAKAQSAMAQAGMAQSQVQAAAAQAIMVQTANQDGVSGVNVRAAVQAAAQQAMQSATLAVSEASIAQAEATVAAQLAATAVQQAAGQGPEAQREARAAVLAAQQALALAAQARAEAQAALQAAQQVPRF